MPGLVMCSDGRHMGCYKRYFYLKLLESHSMLFFMGAMRFAMQHSDSTNATYSCPTATAAIKVVVILFSQRDGEKRIGSQI